MKTNIFTRKVSVKDSDKEMILKKVNKLAKFFDENAEASVVISEQKEKKIVELTIVANDMIYRAEERNDALLAAVDAVEYAVDRQIRKNKTRLAKKLRSGGPELFTPVTEDEVSESEIKIVRTKTHSVKPMHPEEAVLQMELLGHSFYVFRNCETEDMGVVYKRKEGDYGLIDLE